MLRRLMKSKVHRATITAADLNYEGSLTLDRVLMDAADLVEFEEIHVVNVNNGQRLVTYIIPGAPRSGTVQLNGAAARLGMPGDPVILIAYGDFEPNEVASHTPRVVFVDPDNQIDNAPAAKGR